MWTLKSTENYDRNAVWDSVRELRTKISKEWGGGRLAWELFESRSRERELVLSFDVIKCKWAALWRREEERSGRSYREQECHPLYLQASQWWSLGVWAAEERADHVWKQKVKEMFREGDFADDWVSEGLVESFTCPTRIRNGSEKMFRAL